jgi:hypothetical protein
MPNAKPVSPPLYPKYRASFANRLALGLVLPAMLLAFGYAPFTLWQRQDRVQGTGLVLLGDILLAEVFMLYALVAVFKNAILITDDRLIEQNAWPLASKELRLQDIAGFRSTDKATIIYPTQPDLPRLSISKGIEFHDDFQFWLASNYSDLDQTEAEATRALLLADEELGITAEARADKLERAKYVSNLLGLLGGPVAIWLIFWPQPYTYALVAGLAMPLLVAGALFLFPRLMRLEAGKNQPEASSPLALLLPSIGLLTRALDVDLVFSSAAWPVVGGVAVALGVLLMAGSRYSLFEHGTLRRGSGGEWLLLVGCAAAYGYGATLTVNKAFDTQAPTLYRAQVQRKHLTQGKGASHYLTLSPWGPRTASEDVKVSAHYYARRLPGDSLTIVTRPGRLGIPWFRLAGQ